MHCISIYGSKDMSWKQALASARRGEIVTALQSEKNSLGRILTKFFPDDPKYSQAVAESVSGRYLLDERRSGQMKVRGVKQGFKEDKALADGPDFTSCLYLTSYFHMCLSFACRIQQERLKY